MFNRVLAVTFILLLNGHNASYAAANSCGETLPVLCQDCSVNSWDDSREILKTVETYENPNQLPVSNEILLLLASADYSHAEQVVESQALNLLEQFSFGKKLIEKVVSFNSAGQWSSPVNIKLYFEVPIVNNNINFREPRWVVERSSIHELFGAFDSDRKKGTIALNNYQSRSFLPYTFTHELFHLIDGNPNIGDTLVDRFLKEYRALLAEVEIHQEYAKRLERSGLACQLSTWHNQFFGLFTNTENSVYKKTLDLLYPEDPEVSPIAKGTYEYLSERLGYRNNFNKAIKVGFTKDPITLKKVAEENKRNRDYIEQFFKQSKNKVLLEKSYIYNLRSEGLNDSGGTRPRGSTGG